MKKEKMTEKTKEKMIEYLNERITESSNVESRQARARAFDLLRFTRGLIDAYEDVRESIENGSFDPKELYKNIKSYRALEKQYWDDEESRNFYGAKAIAFEYVESYYYKTVNC